MLSPAMSSLSPLSRAFSSRIAELLACVEATNAETLAAIAPVVGQSIADGGVLHLFGSGHSSVLAQELVHRAGGLAPASAILDPTGGFAETLPGFGARLLQRHHRRFQLLPGETLIVISNSGRNPAPIEVAMEARELGLRVVALTSLAMSRKSTSLHPSGKRLFEVADFILDNHGAPGDAAIAVPGTDPLLHTGPTSTLTGAHLLQLLALEVIAWLTAHNHCLPLLRSANLPGGRESNATLDARWRDRISRQF